MRPLYPCVLNQRIEIISSQIVNWQIVKSLYVPFSSREVMSISKSVHKEHPVYYKGTESAKFSKGYQTILMLPHYGLKIT